MTSDDEAVDDQGHVTRTLSRTLEQQTSMNRLLRNIQAAQTPAQILEAAIDTILEISWLGVKTSAAAFLMRGDRIRMIVSRNLHPTIESKCKQLTLGHCLCGRAAESGETIVCGHVDADHDIAFDEMEDHGHVVLPLRWRSKTLGVLNFYLPAGQALDAPRIRFLEAVADIVATALGRVTYQSQLAQSERLSSVGMLAAGVAHEVNNPLAYVLSSVEWLAEDLPPLVEQAGALKEMLDAAEPGDPKQAELVKKLGQNGLLDVENLQDLSDAAAKALKGVKRVRSIVRDLSTFSRADTERPHAVLVPAVLDSALNMAHNEIKYRARIARDLDRRTPQVIAHEGRLAQVFLNLLVNAAHAIEDGGVEDNEIGVYAFAEGDEVVARISDTGKGIEAADLPYIFEPFFTTKPSGVGTGLGLYITHDIINGYGGSITVDSTPGKGTTFTVRLPVARELGPTA